MRTWYAKTKNIWGFLRAVEKAASAAPHKVPYRLVERRGSLAVNAWKNGAARRLP
jgi:hypothetical protein